MDDETLNKMLNTHVPPAASSNLASKILAAKATLDTSNPAKDSHIDMSKPFLKRFAPLAASILAVSLVGYTFFTPAQNNQTETEVWQEAALDLGFDEIYTWVESEDRLAQ